MHATVAVLVGLAALTWPQPASYVHAAGPHRFAEPKLPYSSVDAHSRLPYGHHHAGPTVPPYLAHHPPYHLFKHPAYHHPLYHHPGYQAPYHPPTIHNPPGAFCDPFLWGLSTGDMFPHVEYYPESHGYHYFRPYNWEYAILQSRVVKVLGGDPRNPYDNRFIDDIFDRVERGVAVQEEAAIEDTDETIQPAPLGPGDTEFMPQDMPPQTPPAPLGTPDPAPAVPAPAPGAFEPEPGAAAAPTEESHRPERLQLRSVERTRLEINAPHQVAVEPEAAGETREVEIVPALRLPSRPAAGFASPVKAFREKIAIEAEAVEEEAAAEIRKPVASVSEKPAVGMLKLAEPKRNSSPFATSAGEEQQPKSELLIPGQRVPAVINRPVSLAPSLPAAAVEGQSDRIQLPKMPATEVSAEEPVRKVPSPADLRLQTSGTRSYGTPAKRGFVKSVLGLE